MEDKTSQIFRRVDDGHQAKEFNYTGRDGDPESAHTRKQVGNYTSAEYIFSNQALSIRGVYDSEGDIMLDFSNPALALALNGDNNVGLIQPIETPPIEEITFQESRLQMKDTHFVERKGDECDTLSTRQETDSVRQSIGTGIPYSNRGQFSAEVAKTHASSSTTSTPDESVHLQVELNWPKKSGSAQPNRKLIIIFCLVGFGLSLGAGLFLLVGHSMRRSNPILGISPTTAPTPLYTPPPVHSLALDLGLPPSSTGFWTPFGEFNSLANNVSDTLGTQVGISFSGTRVAISAPFSQQEAGQVYVFEFDAKDNRWTPLGDPIVGAPSSHVGESLAFSGSGEILAVGALFASNSREILNAGTVTLYRWDGLIWNRMGQKLEGEQQNQQFGSSISLSAEGMRVAIGSWRKSVENRIATGEVRMYEYNTEYDEWMLLGLPLTGLQDGDQFGRSVSISASGNRVAIGSPKAHANFGEGNVLNPGHVRVFDLHQDSWVQFGSPITGLVSRGSIGSKVSLSGDGLSLSVSSVSTSFSTGRSQGGEVRVYMNKNTEWHQIGQAISGEDSDDGTPTMLSFDGTKLAVASEFGDRGRGGVRTYEFHPDANVWKLLGSMSHFSPEGDTAQSSLALSASGYRIIIADDSGSVRILEF